MSPGSKSVTSFEYCPATALNTTTSNMGLSPDPLNHGDGLQGWVLCQVSKLNGTLNDTILTNIGISEALPFSLSRILSSFASLFFAWYLGSCIWYRYMSPISNIPGPFLASFSRLWLIQTLRRGKAASELADLHEKHGEWL